MRGWTAVTLACLLAGCSEPDAEPTQSVPDTPELVTPPLLALAHGTYKWHELSAGPSVPGVLVVYSFATQTIASPCSWDGGAYFSNHPIPTGASNQRLRNGTLRVSFDWTDADYPFPTLVAGYKAPGMDAVVDSPRIARGETVELRIQADPAANNHSWDLYACINRSDENTGDATWQPGPFLGSFTVHAEFQGDPEPAIAEPEDDGRRTSRG